MRRSRLVLVACGLLGWSAASHAQSSVIITSGSSTVRQIIRYTDVVPTLAPSLVVDVNDPANAAVCRGGWLNNTDGQFRDVLQLALAAKLAGLRIRLDGDPTRLFPGSSDRYCYINLIIVD